MLNGIWTNNNAMVVHNNGSASSSQAANTLTYVGTIYCTANGQTGMNFTPTAASGGTNNILGLYNAHNRVRVVAYSRDSTANWAYSTATWRAANNNNSNRISWVDGLQQSAVAAAYVVSSSSSAAGNGGSQAGIDFDSTSATPASYVQGNYANLGVLHSSNKSLPLLGLHFAQAMESGSGSAFTGTYFAGGLQVLTLELEM